VPAPQNWGGCKYPFLVVFEISRRAVGHAHGGRHEWPRGPLAGLRSPARAWGRVIPGFPVSLFRPFLVMWFFLTSRFTHARGAALCEWCGFLTHHRHCKLGVKPLREPHRQLGVWPACSRCCRAWFSNTPFWWYLKSHTWRPLGEYGAARKSDRRSRVTPERCGSCLNQHHAWGDAASKIARFGRGWQTLTAFDFDGAARARASCLASSLTASSRAAVGKTQLLPNLTAGSLPAAACSLTVRKVHCSSPDGHPNSPTCGHLKFPHLERGVTAG